MFLKKHLAFSFSVFIFVLSIFFLNTKLSFADDCNISGGLCVPNEPIYTGECTSTDPTLTGCTGNGICCLGGPTCLSKGGTCGTSSSCTNGTINLFRCEGGTNNVCCISNAVPTTIPQPTLPLTQPTINPQDQENREKLAGFINPTMDIISKNQPSLETFGYANIKTTMITTLMMLGINENSFSGGTTTAYIPSGLIGILNNSIASLFNPQASGIQYLAELKDNFLGKPAYAQGAGFTGLQAILPVWRGFRNTTYILFSIVFIIIGIMIMLRVKISPQAVITIQSAIPKLITALILVTFSYAIAGLLIDLSYFIQNLVLVVLFQTQGTGLTGTLLDGTFSQFAGGGLGMVQGLMWRAIPFSALTSLGSVITGIIGGTAGGMGIILGTLGAGPAILVGFLLGAVAFILILLIIIVIFLIKFWFGLIKCYVTIIFKIILAPLEIGLGAFPNSKIGFSSWFIDVIANLSVFPVSYIFLIIANILIDKTTNASLWVPSLLSSDSVNTVTALSESFIKPAYAQAPNVLTTSLSGGLVPVCIGLATLGIASKLPDLIVGAFKEFKKNPWATAIGETYGKTPILSGVFGEAGRGVKSAAGESFGRYVTSAETGGLIPTIKARFKTSGASGANPPIKPVSPSKF